MRKRLIGASIVLIYALLMVISPQNIYVALVYLLGTAVLNEVLQMFKLNAIPVASLILFSLLYYAGVSFSSLYLLIPTAAAVFLFAYFLISEGKVPEVFWTFTGVFIYIIMGFISIGKLSKPYFLLLLSIVWSTDTFAYLVGKYFGRKKLLPQISPKKTVEGAIGGSIGGVLISYILGQKIGILEGNIAEIITLLTLTVIAQLGDLMESFLKRRAGVKDSGNLIPGHGGVFDRLDSTIAVAPFLAVFGGLQ
ncbi:MAG: phosphatidate cytidylyltransferase [Desulfurobacteriaceae bacterium]